MIPNGHTRLIFLAGDPTGHTRGYDEYAAAIAAAAMNAAYLPAHVPAGMLGRFLDGVRAMRNLAGVVATIPHKADAFALARPDAAARRAGSANLLRPAEDGGWECSMVDGTGFLMAAAAAGMVILGRRVQLLGAGGAGRGVAMAIAEQAPARLAIHDADPARAASLTAGIRRAFPSAPVTVGLGESELLVNCSPVGMGEDTALPLPDALIPDQGDVYDIVNREDTPLILAARARGCRTDHGRSMMLAQIPLVLRWLLRR